MKYMKKAGENQEPCGKTAGMDAASRHEHLRFSNFPPRSQILFGNALAEAISLLIPTRHYYFESARNKISRRTGSVPK
jgi:hypothetical protein